MKNKIGKILGLIFLLNLMFFIGTGLFFTNNESTGKINDSVSRLHSSPSTIESLVFLAENIEIDEEELDEVNKYPTFDSIDFNNSIYRISLVHHYISRILLDSHKGKKTDFPVYKLHCVYLI